MLFLEETIIFGLGILILNAFMFQFLSTSVPEQSKIYLADVTSIVLTYPIVLSMKYISTIVAIFFRFKTDGIIEKIVTILSCLIISPITFSIVFIFLAGVQLSIYTGLYGRNFASTLAKVIVLGIGILGTYGVNKMNVYFWETASTKNGIVKIFLANSLPLQKIKSSDGYD